MKQDQTKAFLTRNLKIWHLGIQKIRNAVLIKHKRLRIREALVFFQIVHPIIQRLPYIRFLVYTILETVSNSLLCFLLGIKMLLI